MCYMIVVGLPQAAQQHWIARLPSGMRAGAARYEGLSTRMGGFPTFIVTTGMCSCDLFNRGSDQHTFKKYQKKGWSKTKIERAIANQKKANIHAGLHPDLRHWLADAAIATRHAYLLVHWDSAPLPCGAAIVLTAEELREQTLPIKDEQLIHVRPPR